MSQLSLFELNSLVQESIGTALPDMYWVEAELMEIRESRGHCYMELIQKDLFSSTPVARASAKCWRTQWMKVSETFQKATGGNPIPGMKILLKVSVDFHPAYGFSLIVDEIDPTYTLGEMAHKRQEIIDQLKEEGVFDLQRELRLPLFCQRIAVVSSQTAAGYQDFLNQLLNNGYGLKFYPTIFPAVMQGELIEQSVIKQLNEINNRLEEFDCVVIIRGGGATSDMSGFDSLPLAENVANFPIPIITGIGHERDECVLDLISFQKVKTPTAAAAFLVSNLADVLYRVDAAKDTILANIALLVERQKTHFKQLSTSISMHARLYRSQEESNIEKLQLNITSILQQMLFREKYRLQLISQKVDNMDPHLMLKRGYSITLLDGKILRDASTVVEGQEIETVLEKGKIKSQVK